MNYLKNLRDSIYNLRLTTYNLRLLLIILIGFFSFGFSNNSPMWQRSSRGIYEADIRSLSVHPQDDSVIYAGTAMALYKSDNRGRDYRAILQPSGEHKGVNFIYVVPDQPETVYAAADGGLYESRNAGGNWNRIYYSSDAESRTCLAVIQDINEVYLGTLKGLFHKAVQETSWHKVKNNLNNEPVYHIVADKDFFYFATGRALFRLDKQTGVLKQIFSTGIGEIRNENGPIDESSDLSAHKQIKSLQVSDTSPTQLYIASSKGIYTSYDFGEKWHRLPSGNIPLEELTSLVVLENKLAGHGNCQEDRMGCRSLLAGTKRGAFTFKEGRWIPLYKGMETNGISYLEKDAQGRVYAATDQGVFYLALGEALPSFQSEAEHQEAKMQRLRDALFIEDYFRHEPKINDVHQIAIEYAEVSSKKIKDWRRLAQKRAWLPQLDVGFDGDRDWSSSDSIWGSYSGGGQHYVGPDDKTRGEDFGWDVSLSWDLADLIWSTDQTTIDSRSKLMVELREDILDQVTRLYFERRRIQVELMASASWDSQLTVEKEMRIAELTALIDALTGGEFSRRIRRVNTSPGHHDTSNSEKEERDGK